MLAETLAECPLIQLSFSYSFFFGTEIYQLEIFIRKNKHSRSFQKLAIRKKKYPRSTNSLAHEKKYARKLVRLGQVLL